jgi:hypothetical protein
MNLFCLTPGDRKTSRQCTISEIIIVFQEASNTCIIEFNISTEVKDDRKFTATFSRPMCLPGSLFTNFSNFTTSPFKFAEYVSKNKVVTKHKIKLEEPLFKVKKRK